MFYEFLSLQAGLKANLLQKGMKSLPVCRFIHKKAEAMAGTGNGEQLLDLGGAGIIILIDHRAGDIHILFTVDKEGRDLTVCQGLQGIPLIRVKAAQQTG